MDPIIIIVGILCLSTIILVYFTYTNNKQANIDITSLQTDIAQIKKNASDLPIPQIQTMILAIQNEIESLKSNSKTNSDINTIRSQILELQNNIQNAINAAASVMDLTSKTDRIDRSLTSTIKSIQDQTELDSKALDEIRSNQDLTNKKIDSGIGDLNNRLTIFSDTNIKSQTELTQKIDAGIGDLNNRLTLLEKSNIDQYNQLNDQLNSTINTQINNVTSGLIELNNKLADILTRLDNYGIDINNLKSAVAALQSKPQQQTSQLMTTCIYTKGLTHDVMSTLMINRRGTIYGAQYLSGNPQGNGMWWDTYTIPSGYDGAWRFEVGGWRCGQGDGRTSMRVMRDNRIVYFQTRDSAPVDCNVFTASYMWHGFRAGDQVTFRVRENNGVIGNYNITNPNNQAWGNFNALYIGPPVPAPTVAPPTIAIIGLDSSGNLYRSMNNGQNWFTFTRKFNYLTVGGDFIACIDSNSNIFHTPLNGDEAWTQIPGGLSHINAGYDTIVGVNSGGQIFYSINRGNWVQIGGALANNAVDENRTIYGVNGSLDMFSMANATSGGFSLVNNNPNRINRLFMRDGLLVGLNATGGLFVSNIILGGQPNWVQIDTGVDYAATRGGYIFALKGGVIRYTNDPFSNPVNWNGTISTLPTSGFRMFDVSLL
jgi:hypothetical protein